MSNYTQMVAAKKMKSEQMKKNTLDLIEKMIKNKEPVTVATLRKKTHYSRSFFYENQEVCEAIENARQLQKGCDFARSKKTILDKALIKENEKLKSINQVLKEENEKLKDQVSQLKIQIMERLG